MKPAPRSTAHDLTRRRFLRGSAVAATALSYRRIAARTAGTEPSDTLRTGILGLGQIVRSALCSRICSVRNFRPEPPKIRKILRS